MFIINTNCKLYSFNLIKLLSIKVRKVIKDNKTVTTKINTINKFLFMNVSIHYEYI